MMYRNSHKVHLNSADMRLQRRVLLISCAVLLALSIVLGITAGLLLHSLLAPTASTSGNLGRNYTSEDIG